MKYRITIFILLFSLAGYTQEKQKISTIDFVEVVNGNKSEAFFYYENNWKVLREMALGKGYIDSYQLFEVAPTPEAPFSLILITTYTDDQQYAAREKNFQELIVEKGELKLLNDKKPAAFRKTLYSKEAIQ